MTQENWLNLLRHCRKIRKCLAMFGARLAYTRGPAGATAVQMPRDPGAGDLPINAPFHSLIHGFLPLELFGSGAVADAGSLALRKPARPSVSLPHCDKSPQLGAKACCFLSHNLPGVPLGTQKVSQAFGPDHHAALPTSISFPWACSVAVWLMLDCWRSAHTPLLQLLPTVISSSQVHKGGSASSVTHFLRSPSEARNKDLGPLFATC